VELTKQQRAEKTYIVLDAISPEVISFLDANEPFQLLISVIMSAQTTDRQVNEVTKTLFSLYKDAASLAEADFETVVEIIRSTGYYNVKAKNIIKTAQVIRDEFNGKVPLTMQELIKLPGVGRKSASVILGQIGNLPAIIVDTHFSRVVRRVGLTEEKDPTKIEYAIASLLPEERHYRYSMIINRHARIICHARKPLCYECPIAPYCLSFPLV
jgi:endonuclease-3